MSRPPTTGPVAVAAIERAIPRCSLCPRLRAHCARVAEVKRRAYRDEIYWGRPVPGFGDPDARLLLVGLAPGAHGANRTGRMFTGDSSGDFLYGALHTLGLANQATSVARGDGLALRGVYIGATARCAPPDNKPSPSEIAACRPFLRREMTALRSLRAIACLGGIAWNGAHAAMRDLGWLSASARVPRFGHGVAWRLPSATPSGSAGEGLWVVGIYHPSRQNTQTGRLTKAMFVGALRDAWDRACGCVLADGRGADG